MNSQSPLARGEDDGTGNTEQSNQPGGERAGLYLAALALFVVPALIVAAVVIPSRNSTTNTNTNIDTNANESSESASRTGLDSVEIEALETEASELTIEEAIAADDAPAEPDSDNTSGLASDTADNNDATTTSAEETSDDKILGEPPAVSASAIEVSVYNQDADDPGTYSFALRLKSVSTDTEIETDHFHITVVSADDMSLPSFSRFEHNTLPTNSSALALVRAEDVEAGPHFVVVSIGETEIDRIMIEPAG